ncbi:MAG: bifunctional DNA primase/polymerase [Minwuia sp.]|nr:bifunctional DNA primase/polymerase [Minwuia sp.]
MGIFTSAIETYAAAGLAVFPVDPQEKRPLVRNWQKAGIRAARQWGSRFEDVDGVGLVMGPRSRIVEVDIDLAGDAALAAAMERYGETPITIRTASGKSKCWYRHDGEGRHIRVGGALPVDVLGAGFTICPPSRRDDLGADYRFLTGGLDDLDRLPKIRTGAIELSRRRKAGTVREGERDETLWRWCMTEARHCDEVDALIDAARTWAAGMPVPLDTAVVEQKAWSAWNYESAGRNFIGLRRPQVTWRDTAMDDLSDTPEAYFLIELFRRFHRNKPTFAIAPRAMSQAKHPPWHYSRIERARDVLVERGYLEEISPPRQGFRSPGQYRLNTDLM